MREDEEKRASKRNTVLYSTLEKRRAKGYEADLFIYALSTFFLVILLS